jgi:hypothetical protein
MVNIAIIGLGARGAEVYGKYIKENPELAKIVQIADSNQQKRIKYQALYQLPDASVFKSGAELLNSQKIAEAVIIATPDREHYQDTMLALEKGYDILLEKPISPDEQEVINIRNLAMKNNRKVVLCHVLRYAPLYHKIKEIIDSKILGDIIMIDQVEHIGYWHFAHSFVRGNWRNKEQSAPIVLAKTCHDFDNIIWFMGKKISHVSSFGNLSHFKSSQAPIGATKRCLDGCKVKDQCPYDAEKIYIKNFEKYPDDQKESWPFIVLSDHPTRDSLYQAIQEGPYGRCVYHSDNNVMDHQIVNMSFVDNTHAHLTLSAFTGSTYREIKVMGTKGDIQANDKDQIIEMKVYDGSFDTKPVIFDIQAISESLKGHGGGDERLMKDFILYVQESENKKTHLTSIEHSVDSHIVSFAAEKSRMLHGKVIYLDKEENE